MFRGAASSLIQNPPTPMFHGVDGLGDVFKDDPDMSMVQSENAVVALHRLVNEVPHLMFIILFNCISNLFIYLVSKSNHSGVHWTLDQHCTGSKNV